MNRSHIKVGEFGGLVLNNVYAQFQSGAVVRAEQVALGDQTCSRSTKLTLILKRIQRLVLLK